MRGLAGTLRPDVLSDSQIVYLLSSSHSGSTVVGSILGASPNFEMLGEIGSIPRVWGSKRCTCGLTFDECPVWQGSNQLGSWDPRVTSNDCSDRGTVIVDNTSLYAHLLARFQAPVTIVDTSKKLKRLQNLVSEGIYPRVLHITRDPLAVFSSHLRSARRKRRMELQFSEFITYWLKQNSEVRDFLSTYNRPNFSVRAEDLFGGEFATPPRLREVIGQDWEVPGSIDTAIQHQAGGNRVRHKSPIVPKLGLIESTPLAPQNQHSSLSRRDKKSLELFGYTYQTR